MKARRSNISAGQLRVSNVYLCLWVDTEASDYVYAHPGLVVIFTGERAKYVDDFSKTEVTLHEVITRHGVMWVELGINANAKDSNAAKAWSEL